MKVPHSTDVCRRLGPIEVHGQDRSRLIDTLLYPFLHRTITTMRYAHLAPAHQAEAVERLVVSQLVPVLALEPQHAKFAVNA